MPSSSRLLWRFLYRHPTHFVHAMFEPSLRSSLPISTVRQSFLQLTCRVCAMAAERCSVQHAVPVYFCTPSRELIIRTAARSCSWLLLGLRPISHYSPYLCIVALPLIVTLHMVLLADVSITHSGATMSKVCQHGPTGERIRSMAFVSSTAF